MTDDITNPSGFVEFCPQLSDFFSLSIKMIVNTGKKKKYVKNSLFRIAYCLKQRRGRN